MTAILTASKTAIDTLGRFIYRCSRSTVFWLVAATLWVIGGFAIDGTSEPGHHAALILGGVCLGFCLPSKK